MDLIYQGTSYERNFRSVDGAEIGASEVYLYNRIRKKAFRIQTEEKEDEETEENGIYRTIFRLSPDITAIMPVGVYDLQIITPDENEEASVRYYERNFVKVVASALSLDTIVKP